MTSYKFETMQDITEAERLQTIIKDGGSFASILDRGGWRVVKSSDPAYYYLERPNFAVLMDSVEGVPVACVHNLYSHLPRRVALALVVASDAALYDANTTKTLARFVNRYDDTDELGDVVARGDWFNYTPARRLRIMVTLAKKLKAWRA